MSITIKCESVPNSKYPGYEKGALFTVGSGEVYKRAFVSNKEQMTWRTTADLFEVLSSQVNDET